MSIVLADFIKRAYQLYRPFFGLQQSKLWRTLSGITILVCNVLLAIVFAFFNASMNALIGVLEQPGVTYSAFFGSLFPIFGYLILNIAITIVKGWVINYLKWSLLQAIDTEILTRWIKNKAFYGIKFLNVQKKSVLGADAEEINPAQIMSHDSSELLNLLMSLADDFLTKFCHAFAGMVSLYSLSQPLTFMLFSFNFTIPCFLIVGTLAYALLYNVITSYVGKSLRKQELAIRNAKSNLYQQSHHVLENAEPIAFLKGVEFELQKLKAILFNKHFLRNAAANIKLALNVVTKIYYELSLLVPLTLAVPQIIAQKARVSSVFEILPSFQAVLRILTWHNENYENLTLGEVSLTRLERFKALLTAWEQEVHIHDDSKIAKVKSNKPLTTIQFQRISYNKPDGEPLLTDIQFTLEKGKVTLLQADSGKGKTTLLRAIADLWPYMQGGGIITFPDSNFEAHFIPQEGFVHQRGATLVDTILYPATEAPSQEQIADIKEMMRELNLKDAIINDMQNIDDWKRRLSAGEKQRIAIIAAILKKPDILFMDEATSALDPDSKEKVEKLLKKRLSNAAIACIDHRPLKLNGQKQKATKPGAFVDNIVGLQEYAKKPTSRMAAIR